MDLASHWYQASQRAQEYLALNYQYIISLFNTCSGVGEASCFDQKTNILLASDDVDSVLGFRIADGQLIRPENKKMMKNGRSFGSEKHRI